MRKKYTNKGFTLVELIIVIAVIGVLAAILIPTFANVISKANAKSALSDARNTLSNYIVATMESETKLPDNGEVVIIVEKANRYYVFGYVNNKIAPADNNSDKGYDCSLDELIRSGGKYNISKAKYDEYTAQTAQTAEEFFTKDEIMYLPFDASKSLPSGFEDLSGYMDDKINADKINICHGVLLKEADSAESLEVIPPAPQNPTPEPPASQAPTTEPPTPTPKPTPTPTPTPVTYTVSYNENAGADSVTGMPSNHTGISGNTTVTLSASTPARTGYTFKGWGKTASATSYITEVTVTNSDVTVYAIWEAKPVIQPNFTINLKYHSSLNTEDYGTIPWPVHCDENETMTFTVTDLKEAGVWYSNAAGDNYISVYQGTKIQPDGNGGVIIRSGQGLRYTFEVTRNTSTASMNFDIYIIHAAGLLDENVYEELKSKAAQNYHMKSLESEIIAFEM